MAAIDACDALPRSFDRAEALRCVGQFKQSISELATLEASLTAELEAQHGPGRANSPGFRQFMAEVEVSFPTANLDDVRETKAEVEGLLGWLNSPRGWLGFETAFVLTGTAGSGKTHGVCDAALRRLNEGKLSCIAFGHQFRGEPEPWTCLREYLGFPGAVGRDELLDALDAAAEASGQLLIIWVDAVNETRPLSYWRDRIGPFKEAVQRRSHLRLCFTCRTSFSSHCLPDEPQLYVAEHRGFSGVERVACRAFFEYYGLEPPLTPMLQPELSNPLYLRLVCETLRSRGLKRFPGGWMGLATAISAFLDEKERQFALDHDTSVAASIVRGSLVALAREIARSGESAIPWSRAESLIVQERPTASKLHVLDWLLRSDLIIDDAPRPGTAFDAESVVRPAFERLGEFLIAYNLLEGVNQEQLAEAVRPGGRVAARLDNPDAVGRNNGVVSALSILIPEEVAKGTELPHLLDDGPARSAVLKTTIVSYPWRDPSSFTEASVSLMGEGLRTPGLSADAMDAALAVSWQTSKLDAFWLHGLLRRRALASRDSFWCGFLHQKYEELGPVRRLIDAAFELPLDKVDAAVAERWVTVLLWFTAAADRRVKDRASRAAIALLRSHPGLMAQVTRRMLNTDDDSVRERTLLAVYGASLLSRDVAAVGQVTEVVTETTASNPGDFDNALIRDHVRCIVELVGHLGAVSKPGEADLLQGTKPTEWPLVLPTDEEIKLWKELPKLAYSCLDDDFFVYSMNCLSGWTHALPKIDMGKWILERVARHFRYAGSGCEPYDQHMLASYGGGRAREKWAERIGKKYQWIALYQLAARLSDHVEKRRDNWSPEILRQPLILLEERQLDPTVTAVLPGRKRDADAWWVTSGADLEKHSTLPDSQWVRKRDDLSDFGQLLTPIKRDGRSWRLLEAFLSWGDREDDAPFDEQYRNMWIHIQGYLVKIREVNRAFSILRNRNFFGRWMPEGDSWLYGFAGEYPWALPFNTEPEEYYSRGGSDRLRRQFQPACVQLAVEWEHDASIPHSFHFNVPARSFFRPGDLWWDGTDGYRIANGPTVFRDPSVTEFGPSSLIADVDDLSARLDRIGLRLIWTLLGEKRIIGGRHDNPSPRCTFSQVALLKRDRSVDVSKLVFFEDYSDSTGPRAEGSRKTARKSR